jgi:hypothetical protein
MKIRYGIVSGLIILGIISLAGICTAEEPAPDSRIIGADNPLYGLRIAFEDLDESFTFNATERVEKRLQHANFRLNEYRGQLHDNRSKAAENALSQYLNKINQTEREIGPFRSNETGLLHAQEMITKHQQVLADLLAQNPDNTGLARAYNNSLRLEEKFEEKTRMRFERSHGSGNATVLMPVPIGDELRGGMKDGSGLAGREDPKQGSGSNRAGQGMAANQTRADPGQGNENRQDPGSDDKQYNSQGNENNKGQNNQNPANPNRQSGNNGNPKR